MSVASVNRLWSARDALVLKALALVLGEHLPILPRCTHVKGHGGAKAAVRQVWTGLAENRFVLRTDVKSYYASIDHLLLLDQLAEYVKDKRVLNLLGQYLRRTTERGGLFWDYEKGISLDCTCGAGPVGLRRDFGRGPLLPFGPASRFIVTGWTPERKPAVGDNSPPTRWLRSEGPRSSPPVPPPN